MNAVEDYEPPALPDLDANGPELLAQARGWAAPQPWGPVDGGVLPFSIDDQPYALVLPDDGRHLMGWAAHGNWPAIFPGSIHPDLRWPLLYRLASRADPLGMRGCWKTALVLAPEIYGLDWWAVQKIAATCHENWRQFGSWMAGNGFDPAGQPAHRLVSAGIAWMFSSVQEEKDARRLETQIFTPPKPKTKRYQKSMPGFTPQEQDKAFRQAMMQLGGG